ncbi:hypothetical protein [Oceanobacillus profundus]|uniref:Uncharacterized protein n=1 Tax=Oceanobacillus profundus TaxID=372463 RepID=A0A417YGL0_9BACI|nr:hypothetical protein [Oceanobacillus profundus]MBR2246143.1 hypothetical protein [Bacilli bacterium]MBR3119813.1 hypothetical protein [Oceanobacillus sp.]RHW31958.1 hypothetical protein D1B32_12015 [Oceanobacillus profundus]
MTERECAKFHYRLGYYEELIQNKLKPQGDQRKLSRLERKIDEWYFHSIDVVDESVGKDEITFAI